MSPFGGNGAEGKSGWSLEQQGGVKKRAGRRHISYFCAFVCPADGPLCMRVPLKGRRFVLHLIPLSSCLLSLPPFHRDRTRNTFTSLPPLLDRMLHTYVPEGREKKDGEGRKDRAVKTSRRENKQQTTGAIKGRMNSSALGLIQTSSSFCTEPSFSSLPFFSLYISITEQRQYT